jgi:hypothetical protein
MKGKDEDIDILMIQLEFENDQSNKRDEKWTIIKHWSWNIACILQSNEMFGIHKKFNWNSISKIISFKFEGVEQCQVLFVG